MAETSRVSAMTAPRIQRGVKDLERAHPADPAKKLGIIPNATFRAGPVNPRVDYFVERDGMRFAGTHLIIDLWQASNLDDVEFVEAALRNAVTKAGATLLNIDLHHFTPNGGVSGVAVLAESHISIHTWPERAYAAVDVFMCGAAKPHKAVEVLRDAFAPGLVTVSEHKRGVML